MNKEERYNKLDQIVSTTYINIFSLSKNKDIVLKDFDYSCETSKVFLQISTMVSYMTNKEIYLCGSLFDYVRARLAMKNKHIHWYPKNKDVEGIEIYKVAAHEAVAYDEQETVFKEIYNSYYRKEK